MKIKICSILIHLQEELDISTNVSLLMMCRVRKFKIFNFSPLLFKIIFSPCIELNWFWAGMSVWKMEMTHFICYSYFSPSFLGCVYGKTLISPHFSWCVCSKYFLGVCERVCVLNIFINYFCFRGKFLAKENFTIMASTSMTQCRYFYGWNYVTILK